MKHLVSKYDDNEQYNGWDKINSSQLVIISKVAILM